MHQLLSQDQEEMDLTKQLGCISHAYSRRGFALSLQIGRLFTILLTTIVSAGCASSNSTNSSSSSILDALVKSSPYEAAKETQLLELGPEAQSWLKAKFAHTRKPTKKTLRVLAKAFSPDGDLGLQYDHLGIYTANETFLRKAGNCLSFTHLFVAMGRALGMDVWYREIMPLPETAKAGDFTVWYRHIIAYVEVDGQSFRVDFGGQTDTKRDLGITVSDAHAQAQHFSNLGAAAVINGHIEKAFRNLNRSLLIEPTLAYAWSNLGTAFIKHGAMHKAEMALKQSLELDPYDIGALRQLETFYKRTHQQHLAARYRTYVKNAQSIHPFGKYANGLASLASGDARAAIIDLKAAAKELPGLMRIKIYLSKAYLDAGQWQAARRTLRTALSMARSQEDVIELANLLRTATDN